MGQVESWLIANDSYRSARKDYVEIVYEHQQGHECDGHCIEKAEASIERAKSWVDDCFREYVRDIMKEEIHKLNLLHIRVKS